MTHLDQMITDALAQSPDTVVHQLASEVVRLRSKIADLKRGRVVVPEPTGRDLQEMAAEMRVDGDLVDFLAGASKVVLWYRSKLRALPADRALGEGMMAVKWISVNDALPEDGQTVGFVTECANDKWYHGRVLGGRYMAGEFGGFSVPGLMVQASHWFAFPPLPDALRANQGGADHV